MKAFFNTQHAKSILGKFVSRIDGISTEDDFEAQRNSMIHLVVNSMESSPEQWDEQCQINIGWIGDNFISRLSSNEELDKSRLDDICASCFRFLFELYLSMKNELAMEFSAAKRFVLSNLDSFEHMAREQIEFALREMPISIFKQITNNEDISSIKEFNSVSKSAKKLKEDWDTEIQKKEDKVNKLKASLDKYENAFNFVGLFQGFDDLSKEKIKEKDSILYWLKFLSILIVMPILGELIFIYSNIKDIASMKEGLIASLFPTLSLVAISVYYFRVLLFNYKSVKSQLLQIDLRKTLCRFIQHYSDYSSDIKKQDSESLAKFENIIFSGIVSDEGSLPSSYDGIDQIGKLIKSAKS